LTKTLAEPIQSLKGIESKLMDLNRLTCRAYLGLRELKIAEILRRLPAVKRPAKRLLKVLLPSNPVWVQVRSGMSQGVWMRLNLHEDAGVWRGEHEPTLQDALRAVVLPGTVVYDIGAHVGSIALGVARLVGPNGHVVAFEADPRNAETLRENRDRNYLTGTLRVVPSAVWSYSSDGISFRSGGEESAHGGVETDGQCPVLGRGQLIDVPAVALDDFVASGGPAPQLVKIDVEGGEYEVLRGGDRLFSTQRPLIAAEIHHKQSADRIGPWLIEHQYSSRWIVPVEQFPRCLFAWPDTYKGSAWMWTSRTDQPVLRESGKC
jgi:FkbM family methyltransferase